MFKIGDILVCKGTPGTVIRVTALQGTNYEILMLKHHERPDLYNNQAFFLHKINVNLYELAPPAIQKLYAPQAYNSPVAKTNTRYPHTCPSCKGPAYQGFSAFECQTSCKGA